MSFANPWWLLLGLAGVWIVLLHIRRRRVIEVSSVSLWRRLAAQQTPRASLRPPRPTVLLLLQLAVLALIVLALAHPQFGADATPEHRIYLLDASQSMTARDGDASRFERARTHLRRELEAAAARRDAGPLSLLLVGPQVRIVAARLSDPSEVVAALDRLEPGHAGAPWAEAAARLPGLIAEGERVRAVALADGAALQEARAALTAALPAAQVEAFAFGAGVAGAGLKEAQVEPLDPSEGRWRATGQVVAYGEVASPLLLEVRFTPDGTGPALPWAELELELEEGVAPFELELELPGPGLLELSLPSDALPADDRARFVLSAAPRAARVLLLGAAGDSAVARALTAVGGLEIEVATSLPGTSADYDLVVVAGTAPPRHPGTATLWLGLAPEGGDAAPLADPTPSSWRDDHPLASSVDWSAIEPDAALRLPLLPGATALLEATDAPLLQARTTGAGREVVLAFDPESSGWSTEVGFPVFVANLVQWVAPWHGRATGAHCLAGVFCPLEPAALLAGASLVPVAADTEPVALPSPFIADEGDDPARAWTPEGFAVGFVPARAGVWRVGAGGPLLVIDAPASAESDATAGAGEAAPPERAGERTAGWSPSRWLLLAAVALLALETWLAGRGEGRFLRRRALGRDNPLAGRARRVLVLRALTLALLLVALVAPPLPLPERAQRAVLVLDAEDAYDPGDRARLEAAAAALDAWSGGARQGTLVIAEGSGQIADAPPEVGLPITIDPVAGTDLGAALELAAALLGERPGGRIVVAGSGAQTEGSVAAALPELAARGVSVDALPLGAIPRGEALLERLSVPPNLRQGDRFPLQGVVYSSVDTPATLRVWRDGEAFAARPLRLPAGSTRIEVEASEEDLGRHLYEFELFAPGDVFLRNNRDGVIVEVAPRARVALVTPQPEWGAILAEALTLQGVSVETMSPQRLPFTLEALLEYDAVVLANVPAVDLHSSQQAVLETWVRDHGGGLLLLGGENTFGPGGYYQTALERTSPLSSRVPGEEPQVAMLFVLDRSGSMQQRVEGVSRLDIAKRATVDAAALLHPASSIGVVAFDAEATVLLPPRPVTDGEVAAALQRLQAGGGTSILPALEEAYRSMVPIQASTRHIVLMTDGLSQQGDFNPVLDALREAEISVSTVAIGRGADVALLREISTRGGGAFHATTDFRALPSILSQEALLLSGSPVETGAFAPAWSDRSAAFLEGLPDALPPLLGYVRTSAKPGATVHLQGPDEAPLLASWRYGLGRVVAFTSHGAGAWASAWFQDPAYPRLWAQAVRWTVPPVAKPGLHPTLTLERGELVIRVRAVGQGGDEGTGLDLTATVVHEAGGDERAVGTVALREAAPGDYRGRLVAEPIGTYRVRIDPPPGVEGEASDTPFTAVERAVYRGYAARLAFDARSAESLQALVATSGGRLLLGDEALFDTDAPLRWRSVADPAPWALLALLLLLAELTARYAPGLLRRPIRNASSGAPAGQRVR